MNDALLTVTGSTDIRNLTPRQYFARLRRASFMISFQQGKLSDSEIQRMHTMELRQ